jgi:hypothetical protein
MISVITVTCRPEGLDLLKKAMKQQTFKTFDWIIASPFDPGIYGVKWIPDVPKKEGDYWSIYTSYNNAVKEADDLIVSWQDYTYARPDTLERFYIHHLQEPKTLIGAVGNKYTDNTWTVETWRDPRIRDRGYYECPYQDIEWNLCAIPKDAIYSVGGFDETLNKYSSLCGLDVLDRLNIKREYKFKLDESIRSYSLEHSRLPDWEKNNPLGGIYQKHREAYIEMPTLNWLQS